MTHRSPGLSKSGCPPRRRALLAIVAGALLAPFAAASSWLSRPSTAFRATTVADTLRELYPDQAPDQSDAIRIVAADLAENGAVVPIKVETDLDEVRAISIIASKNPVPLVATFVCGPRTAGFVATRIKLAESCEVIAVVETGAGCYQAAKSIEVTIGGCGV